jgi:glutaredoxin
MIVYTNKTCPYCKQIKEELKKNDIEFTERLTDDWREEWTNIITLTGMPTVPTIENNGIYLVPGRDFNNAQHLVSIMQNFKPTDLPFETQVLEKFKSLNYNMHVAFTQVDKILKEIEEKIKENKDDE